MPGERQRVRFFRGRDDARIAYAVHGDGPPLVISSCWLSHLQHDWQSPVWRHFVADLGEIATVIRYDERGFGLSDWDVDDLSFEARYADLELLIEEIDVPQFALMGCSGGAPVAIRYAARHRDRVTRMILHGATGGGRLGDTPTDEEIEAFNAMIKAGWTRPDNLFRRVFTRIFIPDATEEQMGWVDELQRTSTNTKTALAARRERHKVNATAFLPEINAPTLVLHSTGDRASPFGWAKLFSSRIPDARLVSLESNNHILLADEPAWPVFLEEVAGFLAADTRAVMPQPAAVDALSPREIEVLTLAATGLGNHDLADDLSVSVRTVERHLQNAYRKLGLEGRNARAAAVARLLSASTTR